MSEKIIARAEIDNKTIGKIENVEGTITKLKTPNGVYLVDENASDNCVNPSYIFNINNLPTVTKKNLYHPTWFVGKCLDISGIFLNVNPAYNSYVGLNSFINIWDNYLNQGTQSWEIFGESAGIILMIMQMGLMELEEIPLDTSNIYFIYKTEGGTDYILKLVGGYGWSSSTKPAASTQASLFTYPVISASASAATDGKVTYLPFYYVSLTNVRLEDDIYVVTSESSSATDDYIHIYKNGVQYKNGSVITSDEAFEVTLDVNWGHAGGALDKGSGKGWKINYYNAEKDSWTTTDAKSYQIKTSGKKEFSYPDSSEEKVTNIYIGDWTCLYKDTLIMMSDGTTKRIDEIVVGDEIMSPYGIERVEAIKGETCVPFDYYTEYIVDNKKIKIINDHRILYNGRYTHISEIPNLQKTIVEEKCYPYSIYTNKTNTYYANGIPCGTIFSNIKPRWLGIKILYKLYLNIFLKPKRLGKFRKWLLRKLIRRK